MRNILLLSGGLDSMVIYHNMKSEIDECVYIKYRNDHPATIQELKLLKSESIDFKIIETQELNCNADGFYSGRNMKFVLLIRELYIDEDINIIIGNTANDNFTDNTRSFFYHLEDVINASYPHKLRITCPLENRTKKSLINEAKQKHIKFYFCDTGNDTPCMKCHSCKAMADCGYFD